MLQPGPVRAVLAWTLACLIGAAAAVSAMGVANVVLDGGSFYSPSTFLFGLSVFYVAAVLFVGPISAFLVLVIRVHRIRRPWADTVGGAGAAVLGLYGGNVVANLLVYGRVIADPPLLPIALMAGLIAGPAYWWLAGRPRPPYAGAEVRSA
jgi:hypothetical protein